MQLVTGKGVSERTTQPVLHPCHPPIDTTKVDLHTHHLKKPTLPALTGSPLVLPIYNIMALAPAPTPTPTLATTPTSTSSIIGAKSKTSYLLNL